MGFQIFKRNDNTLTVDMRNLKRIGKDDVKSFSDKGFHILVMKSSDDDALYFRTMESDSFTRTTDAEWSINTELYPYTNDQLIWEQLVDWWFSEFETSVHRRYLDDSYKNFDVAETLKHAQRFMRTQKLGRAGRKGRREANLYKWLCNSKRSYIHRFGMKKDVKGGQNESND